MQMKTKKEMTKLQTIVAIVIIVVAVMIGVVWIPTITLGGERNPSEHLFENSQTLTVLTV